MIARLVEALPVGIAIGGVAALVDPASGDAAGLDLNGLAGSQFVALVLSLIVNVVLWKAFTAEQTKRDDDRKRTDADARERWMIVDKFADAQKDQNALTATAVALATDRGHRS